MQLRTWRTQRAVRLKTQPAPSGPQGRWSKARRAAISIALNETVEAKGRVKSKVNGPALSFLPPVQRPRDVRRLAVAEWLRVDLHTDA
jgi:hypothetical protein